METILAYLSAPGRADREGLSIITDALETQQISCDERVLTALLHQWNGRMHNVAGVMSGNEFGRQHKYRLKSRQREKMEIWRGMIKIARYCPEAAEMTLHWMKYWFLHETDPEILLVIAGWQPTDETRQRQVAELWGQCRVSGGEINQLAAWKFGWRFLKWDGKNHPGWEDAGNNYLEAMRRFLKTVEKSKLLRKSMPDVIANVLLPHGLGPQERIEWKNLWVKLLQVSNGRMAGVAAAHLLELVAAGMADQEETKETIFMPGRQTASQDSLKSRRWGKPGSTKVSGRNSDRNCGKTSN